MTLGEITRNELNFNPAIAGKIGIAIGILAVISIITLGLLYSGFPFFGPINDITNAIGGLLSALFVWQFHALLRQRAPGAALFLLLVAWAGATAIIINSMLVAVGRMHWMTGGMYTAIGFGLLGVWLFAMLSRIGPQPVLSPGILRLGKIAAIFMWVGLLAGPLLAFRADLNKNPLVWIAYAGAAAGWLLYPLWCWLVGRALMS